MTLYDLNCICLEDFMVEIYDAVGEDLLFKGSISDAVYDYGDCEITSFYLVDNFSLSIDILVED